MDKFHFCLNSAKSSVKTTTKFRVSVQGVKSLGGHFACLCRGFDFYEAKKYFLLLFFKKKRKILLIIFIAKSLQKEQNSTNLLLWLPICRNKPAITPKWFNSLDTNSIPHPIIFRLFINGKFDAYVLWPLVQRVQNWIVDLSTAWDFMVHFNLLSLLLSRVSAKKYTNSLVMLVLGFVICFLLSYE